MRILELDTRPFHRIAHLNATRRGVAEPASLPVLRGTIDSLPDGLDALLIASDLQGVVADHRGYGESRLLGLELADAYVELAADGDVPDSVRTGVLLAGDLYAVPEANRRGGYGDVRHVWRSFAERFAFVVGVEGNHDGFGGERERERFEREAGVHLLDGSTVRLPSRGRRRWTFGGVGLVIGSPTRLGRRDEANFLAALELVLKESPDVLVLHEGPAGDEPRRRGSAVIRSRLESAAVPLVVCGHSHWVEPLARLANGTTVLNVDARAVVLDLAPEVTVDWRS